VILGQNLETAATQGSSWIDVRDLAIAHVKAIENEEAGGERIIVAQGVSTDCRTERTSLRLLRTVHLAELG
jgi:nucleoside-diphosphate-sugar epimerase